LIRLDSAKGIKGFSLAKFGRALLDETRIWLDLGSAWGKSVFNSCDRLYWPGFNPSSSESGKGLIGPDQVVLA
jgi:hypothetical protein